jgi:hypothetical protein
MPSSVNGNGNVVAASDVTTGTWDSASRTFTPGGSPANAVQVAARRSQSNSNPVSTLLARALSQGTDSVDVSASAIAAHTASGIGSACIIALNPNASQAFFIKGNASVTTHGCNVQVDSCNQTDALKGQGNTQVVIESGGQIKVCGQVLTQGPATFTPPPITGASAVTDPFVNLAMLAPTVYASCDHTNFSSTSDVTLYPGVYCGGITLTGGGTAIFASGGGPLDDGLFVIKDGELSVAGNKNIEGDGVTIFLTGSAANLNFGGTANIGLTAPTVGLYPGFVVIGDRDYPATNPHLMRGTAMGGYNGHVYLPNAELLMQGTANGSLPSSDCTTLIADTITLSGTPNIEAEKECTTFGGSSSGGVAKIVN